MSGDGVYVGRCVCVCVCVGKYSVCGLMDVLLLDTVRMSLHKFSWRTLSICTLSLIKLLHQFLHHLLHQFLQLLNLLITSSISSSITSSSSPPSAPPSPPPSSSVATSITSIRFCMTPSPPQTPCPSPPPSAPPSTPPSPPPSALLWVYWRRQVNKNRKNREGKDKKIKERERIHSEINNWVWVKDLFFFLIIDLDNNWSSGPASGWGYRFCCRLMIGWLEYTGVPNKMYFILRELSNLCVYFLSSSWIDRLHYRKLRLVLLNKWILSSWATAVPPAVWFISVRLAEIAAID